MTSQNGVITDTRQYFAYGSKRGGDELPFEPNYTGQRLDNSGLLYYNARYYDPELGMFISPDSMIPDPGDYFSYNRYLYARGNPISNNDPTGHCPAPSEDSGRVLCVDFFIQTETILGNTGYGDNRGWSTNSDPSASRAYFYLYLDENNRVIGQPKRHVNMSHTRLGSFEPRDEHNMFEFTQDESGTITIRWSLANGVSSQALYASDVFMEQENTIHPGHVNGSVVLRVGGHLLDPINGEMTLAPDASGKFELQSVNRDPYPSLEVYQYSDGQPQRAITRRPESESLFNMGPAIYLHPWAPNDYWSR